ncbi:MAG: hypothetical protein ACC700_15410 [Anaerolineales bacterium]
MAENEIDERAFAMPNDWWQTVRTSHILSSLFERHVLGLFVGGFQAGEYQHNFYTGFLLRHGNYLLWLTAGHVVDELNKILNSRDFEVTKMTWLDRYEGQGDEGVIVHNRNLLSKSWMPHGLDLGVIVVSELDAGNLLANKNIRLVEESIWHNLSSASPEGYYLVGYPKAWNELTDGPQKEGKILRSFKADLACLPIQPIEPPSETSGNDFWSHPDAFFGRILPYVDFPEFDVDSLAGMSGGPILSIERTSEGQIAYRLVGIQSSWLWSEGVIRAEPIDKVAEAISQAL